jgi:beta-xylosidase
MKKALIVLASAVMLFTLSGCKHNPPAMSGNPLWGGEWYADPEVAVFEGKYWIFPTWSKPYREQVFLDCFSSDDLVNWTKHEKIITKDNIPELNMAMWAPSINYKDGKYYLYFSINDFPHYGDPGGICVATADYPSGPYGRAEILISEIVNGAQPIDQFVFRDDDGTHYMYYGGWKHCNIKKMGEDMKSFVPFDDGTMVKEITPKDYVEGPFMLKKDGKYYFMWSEGGWTRDDYRVAYAIADSPFGPFERIGTILQSDPEIGTGAGHHSVFKGPGKDEWYIVYHRHPLGAKDGNNRVTCIDRMYFEPDGTIRPIKMTFEGVPAIKKGWFRK